jgi:glycosyltransferase involved in cell wall biosynthesis
MLSALIPTCNSERTLAPVLSALVSGSAEGLLREVILADGGSTDGTERIADAAGCNFRSLSGSASARLKAAADTARADWLLILDPAAILQDGWTREAASFMQANARAGQLNRAAAFRYAVDAYGIAARAKELAVATLSSLSGRPRSDQPLLVARRAYLTGNIGRVVALRTRALLPG